MKKFLPSLLLGTSLALLGTSALAQEAQIG